MVQFRIWYRSQPPALRALLIVNVVIYVLWVLLLGRIDATQQFFFEHLALRPAVPGILFEPWQLLTYNFLHLGLGFWGLIHILFNMLWLYWIGKEYEEMHGAHQLFALYVITGVGGGLLTVLFYAFFPGNPIVYGASASVLGVLTAVGVLYPYKKIALFLIGTVRLIYLVIGFLVLDLLFFAGGSTAVAAHMGGALFGFLFARAERSGIDLTAWARPLFGGSRSRGGSRGRGRSRGKQSAASGPRSWFGSRPSSDTSREPRGRSPREERDRRNARRNARQAEVDRILDKISARGYEALSDEEKRILQEASGQ